MTQTERRYWLDTTYDRLDRMKLVELVHEHGYAMDGDELALATRSELIDLLVSTRVEAEYDAEEADSDYPLRRPVMFVVPSWLTDKPLPRVHLRWEEDWQGALDHLLDDDASWDLPSTVKDGDVVLTVLACGPPVVAAVERITQGGDGWQIEDRTLIAQPITWWALWRGESEREELRGFTGRLAARAVRRLIRALQAEAEDPKASFLDAGDCTFSGERSSAIAVLARLQSAQLATDAGQSPLLVECGSCGSTDSLEVHFDRPLHETVQLEIQDHLDDVTHLCSDCHRVAHAHSVASQRRAFHQSATTPCPACGEKTARPIVWGMPLPDDLENNPDVVFGGCVIDDPIPAQWHCDHCGEEYVTVSMTRLRQLQACPLGSSSAPAGTLHS